MDAHYVKETVTLGIKEIRFELDSCAIEDAVRHYIARMEKDPNYEHDYSMEFNFREDLDQFDEPTGKFTIQVIKHIEQSRKPDSTVRV